MAKEKTPRTTRSKKTNGEAQAVPPTVTSAPPVVSAVPPVTEVEVKQPETRTARKTIVPKPETKAPVIPINVEEQIRRRAYELSEQRGFLPGHEAEDWLAAEREVLGRYQTRTA